MTTHRRSDLCLAAALASLLCAAPVAAKAARKAPTSTPPIAAPTGLKEASREFESLHSLRGDERLEALRSLEPSVASLLQRDMDSEPRAAARFLAGRIRAELGDPRAAAEAYARAVEGLERGPFGDDADYAQIEALEAAGRDEDAAREWSRWEKRWPQSPLLPEVRLRRAWNALRRGDPAAAGQTLATLLAGAPWMTGDTRVALARATVLYVQEKPAAAAAVLGEKPQGPGATYLRALCLERQGARLKAAALFMEVAERYPDSPLRDAALLAKANTFLAAGDARSAAEEFARAAPRIKDPRLQAEAELRAAGAVFISGARDSALGLFRAVTERHAGTDVAARGQFLVGEALAAQGQHAEAIVELNRVLTRYFQHSVAAGAQYRVARCLDALGRPGDATGAYQAVVKGYPLEPEAPPAAYLAGVGLMSQGKPLAAAPYFQLVLDRYAARRDSSGLVVFATPAHREVVEAALCLLEYAYHRAGNLGQLSGAPHLLLQKMPPSRSPWRAWALLIDADALAAQARFPEAQTTLELLTREFPDHPVGASATRLLAWTYSRQNRDSLAIATEERLLARYGAGGDPDVLSAAWLDIAHERFNQKRYRQAAGAYEDFLRRFPGHPRRAEALYQAGLCYLRLDRAGDAVDRWETLVRDSASARLAERAWARAGDVYFQAEKYQDAKRCYHGLLEHFGGSSAASIATLRLAQCEYNAGHDAQALEGFSQTVAQFPGTPAAREAARGTERALYRLSQSPNGAKVLAQLVEQYPTSSFAADALFQIARRRYQEKAWAQAAEGFRQVVSRFPGYSAADQAQFLMADAFAQSGSQEQAGQAYEQFLSFFPTSELAGTVHFRLGLIRFEAKDAMRAALEFTRALEDSVTAEVRSAARYNLALCQRLIGDADAARTELERYRADFPRDSRTAEVAYQLGDLDETAQRMTDAAREYQTALGASPPASLRVELLFRLGRVRETLGESDAALRAYQQASETPDKDHPFRLSAVARCAALYEAKRDFPRAVIAYRDIARYAKDRDLVAAAAGRASQLEAGTRRAER